MPGGCTAGGSRSVPGKRGDPRLSTLYAGNDQRQATWGRRDGSWPDEEASFSRVPLSFLNFKVCEMPKVCTREPPDQERTCWQTGGATEADGAILSCSTYFPRPRPRRLVSSPPSDVCSECCLPASPAGPPCLKCTTSTLDFLFLIYLSLYLTYLEMPLIYSSACCLCLSTGIQGRSFFCFVSCCHGCLKQYQACIVLLDK